jgi:hypothetical protein
VGARAQIVEAPRVFVTWRFYVTFLGWRSLIAMGNKEGKLPVFEEVPEEEWEKEEHESSQETMTMLNRKFEEMPSKVKSAMEKAGVSEQEIKDNVHIAYTVSYFNFRKEYGDFQIAEKKGKCPQCPKENLLKASMFLCLPSIRSVSYSLEKAILVPTRQHVKSSMEFLDKGYVLLFSVLCLSVHTRSGFGAVFSVKMQLDPAKKKERVAVKKLPHKVRI